MLDNILSPPPYKTFLFGDLNSKHTTWNCQLNNTNGNLILNYTDTNNLEVIFPINSHTHFPYNINHNPSTIDIGIIKNLNCTTPITLDPLPSDHLPIYTEIKLNNPISLNPNNYNKNINWKKFKNILKTIPSITKIDNKDELDQAVQKINTNIQNAIKHSSQNATSQNKYILKLPTTLLDEIKLNRKLRKRLNTYPNNALKQQINTQTQSIQSQISQIKTENWNNKVKQITNKNKNSLWNLARNLKRNTINYTLPPLINPTDNTKLYSNSDKANIIAQVFHKVHTMNNSLGDQETIIKTNKVIKAFEAINPPTPTDQIPSNSEINNIISKIKASKTPGEDKIYGAMIKNLPKATLVSIYTILKTSISLQHFPKNWKNALIIPIKKPNKNHSLPSNYRPISLLPILSKILEKLILNRLKRFLKANNILIPEQFGFKDKHNTTLQLARIVDTISTSYTNNKISTLISLDIEKAFDTVWHQGLIIKLLKFKIPHYLTKIIKSFLDNRTFQVSLKNTLSKKHPIPAGVPQGAVLSPTLFNLYINDIPRSSNTTLSLFADDTALISQSWQAKIANTKIQSHLDKLSQFYNKWKIKINASKTTLTHFTHKKKFKTTTIHINNFPISPTPDTKLLGLTLDKKLTFTKHINNVINKAQTAYVTLLPLLNYKSPLTIELKTYIYQTYILPIILYASPIWSPLTNQQNIDKIQKFQNKILRTITNLPKYTLTTELHKTTNTLTIKNKLSQINKNFFQEQIKKTNLTKNIANLNHLNRNFKFRKKLLSSYT
ncbi:putative RNA-directed DNA polymerase from transposon X-element-like Protein [Tribolium castaneum]|uniref:Putative RNA-directed DNA polymerase from transposon X-element-like Protein n=1 Tax=Tribolium castaneum TaxID=7070 RepID=D7GYA5_TRICA|nr:putative RNA-directed DNA polymerase from transposon X-element-like Protein [Tribolium castaneum]